MTIPQVQGIGEIFKNYRERLIGFIRPRVKNEEDAEDILQEVFYELTESMNLMQPIERLSSWLYTVARNRIIDLYRKKKPDTLLLDSQDDDGKEISELTELLFEKDNSPEMEYLKTIIWSELQKALSELPAEQKTAFELHELGGKSFKEISAITGVDENTLISRKHYAVLYLREKLRNLYNELIRF
ncbi:MAG: sigma-70 family RNA polymerase sigma factor [Ignavibacteriae bacterium]|nr:MAG: sigma-70 family RNA polymerase sigma factor [Ignavibacteriota bacterium]